jgi:hypothetical protein
VATKANVLIGLIAVAGSVLGALLGARVGAKATRDATQQAIEADRASAREGDERQRKAARLLVSLEIDHNLANLRSFWEEAASHLQDQYRGVPEAQRLTRVPIPTWTRVAWDGMTPLLPLTLSRAEIEQANRLYSQLEAITLIRAEIARMTAEKPYQVLAHLPGRPDPVPEMIYPRSWSYFAPDLAERVEVTVVDLIANGNPIAEPKNRTTEAAP